jgi:hypothetical protein
MPKCRLTSALSDVALVAVSCRENRRTGYPKECGSNNSDRYMKTSDPSFNQKYEVSSNDGIFPDAGNSNQALSIDGDSKPNAPLVSYAWKNVDTQWWGNINWRRRVGGVKAAHTSLN